MARNDDIFDETPKEFCKCGHAKENHIGTTWQGIKVPVCCNYEGCQCQKFMKR